ncbi:MAG: hypothetical protein IKV97_03655 [Clostridia bacterium]|nr:hypothetical protein [Clostridia bacterium]
MLKFSVCGQSIFCEYSPAASDSIDYLTAYFSFSPDWYGLTKTAQFTQNDTTYNVLLDRDKCKIPAEIVAGALEISVFGQKAESPIRITTLSCSVNIRRSGFKTDAETPIPPTEDLYSQLLGRVDKAVDNIPKNLSEFNNDAGYAKVSDIPKVPTKVSAFTNDACYAKVSDIPEVPTKVSAFTNDVGYAKVSDIPAVPTKVSAFTNDADYAKVSDIPEIPANVSAFKNDVGYIAPSNGTLNAGGNRMQNVGMPQDDADAATKKYVDDNMTHFGELEVSVNGPITSFSHSSPGKSVEYGGYDTTLKGNFAHVHGAHYVTISAGDYVVITDLCTPENDTDAATKKYVDDKTGDVEAALDGIISIQNSLMGGGAL